MPCPRCKSMNTEYHPDDGEVTCSYLLCNDCKYINLTNHPEREQKLLDWQLDPEAWKT